MHALAQGFQHQKFIAECALITNPFAFRPDVKCPPEIATILQTYSLAALDFWRH